MLHANQSTTALDRAIAAAEEFMIEYTRVSAEHSAAEEAIPYLTDADRAAIKAAEDAVVPPEELWMTRRPSCRVVEMRVVWADGSVKEIQEPTPERFLPEHLSELQSACDAAGLPFAPRLKTWKDWSRRKYLAGQAARPQEMVAAQARFDELEALFGEMLKKRDRLGARILNCKVKTPAEALRQVEAYCRLMETDLARLKDMFEEDKNAMLLSLIGTLKRMSEKANVIPLRKVA